MNEERQKILQMVADRKISPEEANQLLASMENNSAFTPTSENLTPPKDPKFLRIQVDNSNSGERVNVCVPFQLLRAGMRLAALIPKGMQPVINSALKENGIQFDLDALKPQDLEELVNHLGALTVDVDNKHEHVRIFCE